MKNESKTELGDGNFIIPVTKLAYTEKEMLEILPVSAKTLYNLRQSEIHQLQFVNLNSRVLYPVIEVKKWWDELKTKQKGSSRKKLAEWPIMKKSSRLANSTSIYFLIF